MARRPGDRRPRYRASIVLRRGDELGLERELFRLDSVPGPTWRHFFRLLTRRSAPVAVCVVRKPADCAGRFWLRLWENGWDTRRVPNGRYTLTLTVEGVTGSQAMRTMRFNVANWSLAGRLGTGPYGGAGVVL